MKTDPFDIADNIIEEVYPVGRKGKGWWGEKHIPNWGILREAIAKAVNKVHKESTMPKKNIEPIRIGNTWEVLIMGATCKSADIFEEVAKVNILRNKSEITEEEADKMISELEYRDEEFGLEISVIKKDNEHGHESYGYGGVDKIILWTTDSVAGNEMYTGDIQWCKDVAQLLCNCMNINNM